MKPARDVGTEVYEDFAAEAITTVTDPGPALGRPRPMVAEPTLPATPHGTCVNCQRSVTLRRVATDSTRHTYQWVPDGEPARLGRQCTEAALPAYHWADGATAAVYHLAI